MTKSDRPVAGPHTQGFNEADDVNTIMESNDRLAGLCAAMMVIVIAVLIIERATR